MEYHTDGFVLFLRRQLHGIQTFAPYYYYYYCFTSVLNSQGMKNYLMQCKNHYSYYYYFRGGRRCPGGQMSRIPSHPAPPLNAAEHFRILRCHGYEMACRCTTCYGRPVSTHTAQYRRRRCLYVPGPPHPPHPSRRRLKAIAGVMKRDRLPSTATIHGL